MIHSNTEKHDIKQPKISVTRNKTKKVSTINSTDKFRANKFRAIPRTLSSPLSSIVACRIAFTSSTVRGVRSR